MLIVTALIVPIVVILFLVVFQWNSREVGWVTLGMTIFLASLVPTFHRTPPQLALVLGEGIAKTLTAFLVIFSALFFYQMQNASAALASAVSPSRVILLATTSGLLGKEALLLWHKIGPVILWFLALTTLLLVWFTSYMLLARLIALLVLLEAVHVPVISTILGFYGRTSERNDDISAPNISSPSQERMPFSHRSIARLASRLLAYGGLLLINFLYASFSLVSIAPLNRIDPVLFLCFQMLLLIPIALVLLLKTRTLLHKNVLSRGLQLGGFLSVGLLCYTLSLKKTGITETMVFSCANGIIATFIAWQVLKQRISVLTWGACLFVLVGASLVWYTSPAKWQGNFTAFVSGILLTGYGFQIEKLLVDTKKQRHMIQPILGVQLLTMALTTLVIGLCFGQWQTVHLLIASDFLVIVYLSLATIFLPCLIMLVAQQYVSAITVAFFNVIEPLMGVFFAFVYAGERLPVLAYFGVGIVLVGIALQVVAGMIKYEPVTASSNLAAPPIST